MFWCQESVTLTCNTKILLAEIKLLTYNMLQQHNELLCTQKILSYKLQKLIITYSVQYASCKLECNSTETRSDLSGRSNHTASFSRDFIPHRLRCMLHANTALTVDWYSGGGGLLAFFQHVTLSCIKCILVHYVHLWSWRQDWYTVPPFNISASTWQLTVTVLEPTIRRCNYFGIADILYGSVYFHKVNTKLHTANRTLPKVDRKRKEVSSTKKIERK